MDEKEEKREFTQKLEKTAQSLAEAVQDKQGKAFILLGADSITNEEGKGNTQAVIAVAGNGRQVIEVLAQFISNPQTRPLLEEAMKLAMVKRLSVTLEKVVDTLANDSKAETESSTNNK